MKKLYIVLFLLLTLNIVLNLWLYINPDKETAFNYIFNATYGLVYLFGSIVAYKKGMISYAIAFLLYTIGLFTWAYYNLILKVPVPYPGLPDLFFIIFQPFLVVGFINLIKAFGGQFTLRWIIETLLVFIVLFALLFSFLGQSDLLGTIYQMFDSLLVALAISSIRTEAGLTHPNILLFAFAAFLMASADTIFSYQVSQEFYWNGGIADTLFLIAGTLFSFGMLSVKSTSADLQGSEKLNMTG